MFHGAWSHSARRALTGGCSNSTLRCRLAFRGKPLNQPFQRFQGTTSPGLQQQDDGKTPFETVQEAMGALESFSTSLEKVAQTVDRRHTILNSSRPISIAEITLHSRDCSSISEFESEAAKSARRMLLPEAILVEQTLQALLQEYTSTVQPRMERATQLCQDTPCGGASWELDMQKLKREVTEGSNSSHSITPKGKHRVQIDGLEGTPCGRLQLASMSFLETTMNTKPQILMAGRARLILDLAMEFGSPLQLVRKSGSKEQNMKIKEVFLSQVVPTPWIRTDEEYSTLLSIKKELKK